CLQEVEVKKVRFRFSKKCHNLLTQLMKHEDGWVFNVPVDAKGFGLHDYHTIVKEPMDLGTVKAKLGEGLYESPLDFAEDVHSMAKFLLSMFEEKWVPIELQYHNLHREIKPASVVEHLPAPTPSSVSSACGA
ncbi:unnamed protein product, partial [Brassica rapa]